MSMLHRNLIAAIISGLEPVVEGAVTAFVPGGAAASRLIHAGAQAVETIANEVSGDDAPAPAVVQVVGTTIVSPFPAAAAPAPATTAPPSADTTGQTGSTSTAAAPKLTALDVIAALMQTLQALQARA